MQCDGLVLFKFRTLLNPILASSTKVGNINQTLLCSMDPISSFCACSEEKQWSLLDLNVVEQLSNIERQSDLDLSDPPLEVLREVDVM